MFGIAGGLNALFRNMGMISGIAYSVSIFSYKLSLLGGNVGSPDYAINFVRSMNFVYITAAFICLLAGVLCYMRTKRVK